MLAAKLDGSARKKNRFSHSSDFFLFFFAFSQFVLCSCGCRRCWRELCVIKTIFSAINPFVDHMNFVHIFSSLLVHTVLGSEV